MTDTITSLPMRLRLSEPEFCGWLGQAMPGDRLEYHRGFLALDGMSMAARLGPRERKELVRLARRALWAADQGLAHLFQRRNGPDDFSYFAVARAKPSPTPVSLSALLAEEVA